MNKKDLKLGAVIGGAVGVLFQPIATNVLHGSVKLTAMLGTSALSWGMRFAIFFAFLVHAPLALWIFSLFGKILPSLYQFGKFAAVGVLNSVMNVGVITLLSTVAGVTVGPLIPVFAVVGFAASTTNSYLWNKFWTFQSDTKSHAAEAVKFYSIAAVGAVLNVGTVSVVVNYLRPVSISSELWIVIGGLCGVAASFLWDFFGYKYFVFGKKAEAVN